MDKDVIKRKKKQKSGIISGLIFIFYTYTNSF